MHFEVEKKFLVADFAVVASKLDAMGASRGRTVEQADCYYRHPQRDFGQTDEAFRMRQVGDETYLTYKGPRIDAETKSRTEEETRLADGPEVAATCRAMLLHLGFEPFAEVCKQRTYYHLRRDGRAMEVCLDTVDQVGSFVEIEIALDVTGVDDPTIDDAKGAVADVAEQLELTGAVRRSYLQMLLERQAG